jgi:tetratricopeptide (TPR) repeat protein
MKKVFLLQVITTLFFSLASFGQQTNNAELQKMYDEDQGARAAANINWAMLNKKDSLREARVYELIKEGKVVTGRDYYNTAMIFQHGRDTVASAMAVKQMRKAVELDSTINKWLLAAAIDRDLMRHGKPQIYGTQYTKFSADEKWKRYQIDTTQVTDVGRKAYGVETLAEQKIKERVMNLRSISEYYASSKSVDKTVQFIKAEIEKGEASEYNVTESGINEFGYELMKENKPEEALKIFKLNTELYPKGYNTWDSYGECLLKLNKKEEGLKAYQKSLNLNPKNENALKVLNDNK